MRGGFKKYKIMENYTIKSNNSIEAIKEINKLRRQNKNKWFCFNGVINNKQIKAKCYNTWLQICLVGDKDFSNSMEQNVKQFTEHLTKTFN